MDIEASAPRLREAVANGPETVFIARGFIGGHPTGRPRRSGVKVRTIRRPWRRTSLDAESMSVWKDVDGVLNADPKIFPDAADRRTELPRYHRTGLQRGADHPPEDDQAAPEQEHPALRAAVRRQAQARHGDPRAVVAPVDVPILILKKDQVLLTIRSRDFSFVLEEKFATIFSLLERFRIKTNLIHNSAVNLSLCVTIRGISTRWSRRCARRVST